MESRIQGASAAEIAPIDDDALTAEDIMTKRKLTESELAYFGKKERNRLVIRIISIILAATPGILSIIGSFVGW